jgi:predicted lipoprotein
MQIITREHYNQLAENFKGTRAMMSDADCEVMQAKLNEMRRELAFQACVKEWKEGKTINCGDFLEVCRVLGIEFSEHVQSWVMADIIEVGQSSYSCIGKLHKRKENTLYALGHELTAKCLDKSF